MPDSGTCPHCDATLDIDMYGFGLECGDCGGKIEVFRDSDILLETKLETVRIMLPERVLSRIGILKKLIGWG